MHNKNKRNFRAFTLVELLTVIAIIGLMTGMFLVAYQGAAQESNVLKTRGTIQKISEVLNSRMDEYNNYPIAIRTPLGGPIPSNAVALTASGATISVLRERARLLALRDLIRMEMPDHPDDIKFTNFWRAGRNAADFQRFLEGRPPFTTFPGLASTIPTGMSIDATTMPSYFVKGTLTARTKALMTRLSEGAWTPRSSQGEWDKTNANAELLFLIVEGSDLNGSSAIELFGKNEVGDTDNDGLNEFIDAFGQPIRWIRWPAGFAGTSRYYPDMLDPSLVAGGVLTVASEPIDRLGTDPGWGTALQPGTGLSPLVISGGLDRAFGIRFREIDRYSPPTPLPPSVGVFDGRPSYSAAEAPWTLSSYGLNSMPDPWYPRDPSVNGIRMGETVGAAAYELENGVRYNANAAGDNISNFDGTGVSL